MTAGQTAGDLAGKRVLISEDEWLVAEAIRFVHSELVDRRRE